MLFDNNLALKHAVTLVVEHRPELLPTLAMTCGVFDQQRGVDMILTAQKADAADAGLRAFSGKADETLVAHQPGIAGEGKTVEMGARADRGEQAPDMQSASLRNLDVIDPRLITDHQL